MARFSPALSQITNMGTDIFKIVIGCVVGFGVGTLYVDGRQSLEINRLNSQIQELENSTNNATNKQRESEDKLKRLNQKVEQFYKSFKDGK